MGLSSHFDHSAKMGAVNASLLHEIEVRLSTCELGTSPM